MILSRRSLRSPRVTVGSERHRFVNPSSCDTDNDPPNGVS